MIDCSLLSLNQKIATELTFVPNISRPLKTGNWDIDYSNKIEFLRKIYEIDLKQLTNLIESYYPADSEERRMVLNSDIFSFVDCGCIEINHKPTNDVFILGVLYKAIYDVILKQNLVPYKIDETEDLIVYHPTGGGHIHCDIPFDHFYEQNFFHFFKLFEENLIISAINNPYLIWFFRLPLNDEVKNFPSKTFNKNLIEIQATTNPLLFRYRQARSKGRLPTIEFRLFDAPKDEDHALFQARFVQHWVSYIALITKSNKTLDVTLTQEKYQKYTKSFEYTKHSFQEFLSNIGLLYDGQLMRNYYNNYRVRMKHGNIV